MQKEHLKGWSNSCILFLPKNMVREQGALGDSSPFKVFQATSACSFDPELIPHL